MKIDARKLNGLAQEEKRRTAIKLWKKKERFADIASLLDVSDTAIRKWVKAYQKEGLFGIKAKQRGHAKGVNRRLSPDQESALQKMITDKYPDQLKLDYVLWTRKAVQALIKAEYSIDLPVRTVGDYLKRWGFTPQKPAKRAYEQSSKAVKQWLEKAYPAIKKRAKQEGAEIYWGDETGMRSDSQHERGYAPKGKTPVVKLNAKRASINMVSAITNQGKVRFHVYEGTMNTDKLIEFLKRLIRSSKKKVFLILDNLRVHHAYVVQDWISEHKEEIELFYLPSYSPELNPDEYLNCDLKAGVHSGKPARNKDQLKGKVKSHMHKLQKSPERVASYFQHHCIQYAA